MAQNQAATLDAAYISGILHKAMQQHQRKGHTPVAEVGWEWEVATDPDCHQFVVTLSNGTAYDVVIRERD